MIDPEDVLDKPAGQEAFDVHRKSLRISRSQRLSTQLVDHANEMLVCLLVGDGGGAAMAFHARFFMRKALVVHGAAHSQTNEQSAE